MKKHSSLLHTKVLSLDEQISLYENSIHFKRKQVDILISKNQVLQILYKFMYLIVGKFGKFSESSVIRQTKIIQLSTYI